jgi:hypothetical protein
VKKPTSELPSKKLVLHSAKAHQKQPCPQASLSTVSDEIGEVDDCSLYLAEIEKARGFILLKGYRQMWDRIEGHLMGTIDKSFHMARPSL